MILKPIDLKDALIKEKQKSKPPIIDEVNQILRSQTIQEKRILAAINRSKPTFSYDLNSFDEEHIYDLTQIKNICLKYRLRFLDSDAFVGEIPYEAILKIKSLEQQLGQPLNGFKIVAPKEMFQLEDKNSDPLLFLQVAENKFYLIHKWGGELNRFRALLVRPLRNFMSMFWFLAIVAFIFTAVIPTPSIDVAAFLFVHTFIASCGIACLLIFSRRENFSDSEWNSKFLS